MVKTKGLLCLVQSRELSVVRLSKLSVTQKSGRTPKDL